MRRRWHVLSAAFSLLGLIGCHPRSPNQLVAEQLARREGHPVTIGLSVSERRDGHDVICGFYKVAKSGHEQATVSWFGSVDGKLVTQLGPVWNPATTCLINHFDAPLP